ncbi:MAG TPA: hypothetical protein VLD19_13245 [Chitinophagaceae bacterium]|nr:hypothetical protein [Chitinophagaceae bacterium]
MPSSIYANSYTLKPGESIGPASDQYTLIPNIGDLQACAPSYNVLLLDTLKLGYTSGGSNCTFYVQIRVKRSDLQQEAAIATVVLSGKEKINTVISLQGYDIITGGISSIDVLFYWKIAGSQNVLFTDGQTFCGAALLSQIVV